jgi:hypothetical protein
MHGTQIHPGLLANQRKGIGASERDGKRRQLAIFSHRESQDTWLGILQSQIEYLLEVILEIATVVKLL